MRKAIILFSVSISLFLAGVTAEEVSSTQFVGNTESKMIHSYDCNHLPDKEQQVLFNSKTEAEKAGYRECPVCFRICPDIPGYWEERALAMEMFTRLQCYYPSAMKGNLQEKVQTTGKKVLANWPFPKRGYSYEFRVVQSEEVNAWAVPTGFVFVTSELLNMLESDEELEAILAHEIAHIERRHGYREYQSAWGAVVAAGIFGVMAAAVGAGVETLQIVDVLYNVATRIVLSGYGRDNEREADILAKLYLTKSGKIDQKLLLSLKKIKYLEEREKIKTGGVFSTHPDIEERIDRIGATRVSAFEKGNVFVGFDNKGNKVAELRVLWEKLYEGTLELHSVLRVEKASLVAPLLSPSNAGPPGMGTSTPEIVFTIFCSGEKLKFEISKPEVEGLNAEIVFTRRSEILLTKSIDSLTFNLPSIERWEMIKD